MKALARTLPLLALAIVLTACGSNARPADRGRSATDSGARSQQQRPALVPDIPKDTRPADPAAARVVRGWTDAQRASDIARASSYFALPSIVQNGAAAVELRTRADVREFNASLPCGARVLRVVAAGRFTVVTFRLTQRPGARCDGVGHQAATAFLVRAGKIKAWLRIADRPVPDEPGSSV